MKERLNSMTNRGVFVLVFGWEPQASSPFVSIVALVGGADCQPNFGPVDSRFQFARHPSIAPAVAFFKSGALGGLTNPLSIGLAMCSSRWNH